jgi:hypothetical protein
MKSSDDAREHGVMIEELRRFKKQEPFHPFEIIMADRRIHRIPHPDFILVPPRGQWVYCTDAFGNTAHINILVISEVRHVYTDMKKRRKAS